MSLDYESLLYLFRKGEFGVLAKEAVAIADARPLDPRARILIAHALVRVGLANQAQHLLPNEFVALSPPKLKSQAHVTLGLASRSVGEFDDALAHFRLAVKLAQEHGDSEEIAWAQLHLLRHAADDADDGLSRAMIPMVRLAVTKAGVPQVTAYLHVVIGALESQRGRLDEGSRHGNTAASLIELSPNAWLSCSVLKAKASVAIAQCRFADALELLHSAKQIAQSHNLTREDVENAGNLGYVELFRGNYKQSVRNLSQAIESPNSSMRAKMAALESLARVHLALGDLDSSESCFERLFQGITIESSALHSYTIRCASISHGRLLLKRQSAGRAVDWLLRSERNRSSTNDVHFDQTLDLTLAQALARVDQASEAARRLTLAERCGATRSRDVQGQFYYAAAVAVEASNPELAQQLRQRARRLWAHQGIVSLEREMEDIPPPRRSARTTRKSPATAINALGSAIDLAHSPRLLGDELTQTLASIDVKATVASGAAESDQSGATVSISLGTDAGESLTLSCPTPQQPEVAVLVQDVLRIGRAAVELERYREDERKRTALWPEDPIEDQLGALFVSQEMQDLLNTVRRLAATTVPVLITGETGTGKEVIARILHAYSQRAKAPFVPFNCASTPKDMLDSQLFGHRRGAFTGAVEHFPGVIRAADRGTLLLDEIGDMPLDVQPKLLRFLESSEVHPVGEARPSKVDVRVIAATNARLESLVSSGQFREDLYYRLNIVELHIPPLRERRVDIPAIANHYLRKHAAEYRKRELRLAEDAMEYLLLYKWPGNVRQLANEMRRLAAIAESGAVIMPEHLSADIAASRRTVPIVERQPDPREIFVRVDQPLAAAVEYVERALIQHALKKCNGRVEEAATLLGMSRKGLYLKRQRYEIDPPAPSKPPSP